MKMIHTCIRVQDLDKSLKFYEDSLGFTEKRRLDFPEYKFTLVYLTLPGDDYELELTYNYDSLPYDLGNGYGHIALSSSDFDNLYKKHVEAGFEVTDIKGLPEGDTSYYFVSDPDGYKIEIIKE
ncbi:VOC family protein [Streptococcaceae bacterium ESL0729]|nr:VOC family protein [Streptococcaceae bacterium ESL0729]